MVLTSIILNRLEKELDMAMENEEKSKNDRSGIAWRDRAEGRTNGIMNCIEIVKEIERDYD